MLAPPDTFAQLRALAWVSPLLAAMGSGFALRAHGVEPSSLLWNSMGGVALLAALLAHLSIWASRWGTRHQWVSVLAAFTLFVLPWSVMLTPRLQPGTPWFSIGIIVVEGLALLSSALVHVRLSRVDPHRQRLKWLDCEIDLRRHRIGQVRRPGDGSTSLVAPGVIGGLSVVAYLLIQAWLPQAGLIVLGVAISWALGLWLCLWPLGRALGQAWRLRQIERQTGQHFVSEHLDRLTRERQASIIGRWWSRRPS
ncbi:MAG TPA: hypothetical protein VFW84_03390 [Aquabacterium sp.]|uniref:hypothetical protein n=1 Tax=Aquabacterium sp. TaxID=1872578 RepID=UPI002E34C5F9|nr:hypothetical protein [Aquabacterium sp.]HEX5371756.1 hypothetical protein [Aquabacterium sp.]